MRPGSPLRRSLSRSRFSRLALVSPGIVLAAILAVLAASSPAAGQTVTATILGTITDNTGGVMPGVTVTATNKATSFSRSDVTDARGRYRLSALPIGPYSVAAEIPGFAKQERTVQLTVDAEVRIDVTMGVATVEQSVTVTAEAPVVQTTSAEIGALVDQKAIQQLPLNARDIQQLATIQPGVQSQAAYNGLYGANITVRGSRPEQNRYLLNGIDASTTFGTSPVSAAGIIMGVEGLQEFKVMSSDYSAAYGIKQGGVINMVTKSGTNAFHGSGYEFHRDSALDAPNHFDVNGKPPFKRDQFGVSLGGPVKKGRTFFFANYEQFRHRLGLSGYGFTLGPRQRQGYIIDQKSGNEVYVGIAPQMVPFLKLIPEGTGKIMSDGSQEFFAHPQQAVDERYFTTRIDHQLTKNNNLWFVYTRDMSTSNTPDPNPNFSLVSDRNKQVFSVENVHTFSDHFVNSTRVGVNRNDYFDWNQTIPAVDKSMYVAADPFVSPAPQGLFESVDVAGLSAAEMATTGNAPVWYNHTGLSFDTDFTLNKGAHAWKFGGSFQYSLDNGSYTAVQARGEISFQTVQSFLQGIATRANVILPGSNPKKDFRSKLAAAFVEDSWRRERITVTAGLRWEALLQLDEANGQIANLRGGPMDLTPTVGNPVLIAQKGNFAPRLGFNWDPKGNGKTSVRGGAGIFYNQINPFSLRESSNNYPITTQVSINNATFPNVFDSYKPATVLPDFGAIEYRPKTPVLYSYHLAIQRELFARTSVTIQYVGSQGRHLPSGAIVNTDFGNRLVGIQQPDGRWYFPSGQNRPNPNFGRIGYDEFVFTSSYNALQVQMDRRVGAGFGFGANYTFSSCYDDTSGELNTAVQNTGGPNVLQYARDLKSGHGPCSFTSRNAANFTTTWDLPGKGLKGSAGAVLGGWRWSTITTVQSGYPFNVTTGFNQSGQNKGNSALGDRPDWAPGCNAQNVIVGRVDRWFDPNCFVLNPKGYTGLVPSRALRGPGLFTSDWSLTKNFALPGGDRRLEVMLQAFNITNRANFRVPAAALWSNASTRRSTAGVITQTVTPARQLQIGVKFVF